MEKVKTKKELKEAKQAFINRMQEDLHLKVLQNKLAMLSTDSIEYSNLLSDLYLYLDEQFKEQIGYGFATRRSG